MYWRVSKLSCDGEKLPDGKYAPELYLNFNEDACAYIKYDEDALGAVAYPWCIFQIHGTLLHRYLTFSEAYKQLKEMHQKPVYKSYDYQCGYLDAFQDVKSIVKKAQEGK